jgi:hypothetical protein
MKATRKNLEDAIIKAQGGGHELHHVTLHCSSSTHRLCVCRLGGAIRFRALSGPPSTLLLRGTVDCSESQADWSATESRLILAPLSPSSRLPSPNVNIGPQKSIQLCTMLQWLVGALGPSCKAQLSSAQLISSLPCSGKRAIALGKKSPALFPQLFLCMQSIGCNSALLLHKSYILFLSYLSVCIQVCALK